MEDGGWPTSEPCFDGLSTNGWEAGHVYGLAAGDALDDEGGRFVDQDGHSAMLRLILEDAWL